MTENKTEIVKATNEMQFSRNTITRQCEGMAILRKGTDIPDPSPSSLHDDGPRVLSWLCQANFS